MDLHTLAQRCMANTEGILSDAQSWMGHFIDADRQKNDIINALMKQLGDNEDEVNQLNRDLAAEKKSRNYFQMEAERYETTIQRLEQKLNDGSFITVLIDGDGAKFADLFLQNPVEGAPRAAQTLKQEIREYVKAECSELDSEDIPILIRVYANLNGLATSLRLSGVIYRDEDMKVFAEQLTNSRTEVDFVNVGRGKENADSKIRKMLNHYVKSLQCKKIFLACCHDNGYLHDLREYSDKSDVQRKIVLVETTPAEPLFKTLGFPITRFTGVFRSKPLDNETKHSFAVPIKPVQPPPQQLQDPFVLPVRKPSFPQPQLDTQRAAAVSTPEQQHPLRPLPTPVSSESRASPGLSLSEVDLSSRTPSVVNSGNGGTSISYATAGGALVEHQNISIAPGKPKKVPKIIDYNYDGCRIDPPTTHPANSPAQSTYKAKLEKVSPNAFCNDQYLVGVCRRTDCIRVHKVDLTPQEVSIHRYKARTSVCPRGPECDDYDCYLSHHCLKDPKCFRGTACKFANTDYGDLHLDSEAKLKPTTRWTQGSDFPEHLQ